MVKASTKQSKTVQKSNGMSVRVVPMDAPWKWLAAGWQDMLLVPKVSLCYGLTVALMSGLLSLALFQLEMTALVISLVAGFMILAPMLAIGMYEASRRLEAGQPVNMRVILAALFSASPSIYLAGVLLMVMFLAWFRIATLLFALFYGTDYPPLTDFIESLFFSSNGLGLLIVGSVIGAVFAIATMAATVVSIPIMLERDVDTITAIITSVQAFQANLKTMAVWAAAILALMAVSVATLFLGMVVAFPLLGHASWHAYRDLVGD